MPDQGRRFGPYEILSRVGGGGMGHVFRAWDARLHREVAVKILHNEYAMPGMRERFLREARAASALNHPNICTVFDIGEQDGDPYLVMELLEGETLKDRIDKRNMSIEEMLCVGKEVAEALSAAHAKGVIHRDIKPANIFLVKKQNGGFQAKVLDFGLAKIEGGVLGARGARSLDITTAGSTVGTLAYMSPEQARGEVLDSRSDLFSLGVVMYEVATQQIPFPGATSALVFVKLLNQSPEPVRDWNESIPRDFEKVIFKLMAKERTARYQTANELYEALTKVGDKPAGGGWLRKAVTNVPQLRQTVETTVKERRGRDRKSAEEEYEQARESPTPQPVRPASTPRPSNDQPQFLRPVARVPRGDATPSPSSEVAAEGTRTRDTGRVVIVGSPFPAPVEDAEDEIAVPAAVVAEPVAPAPVPQTTSGAFAASLAEPEILTPRVKLRVKPLWLAVGLIALIVIIIAVVLVVNRGHFGPTMLTETDSVVLTEIENRTGNKTLDGTVAQGLQIALSQSPYLLLRSDDAYRTMRHQVAPDAVDNPGEGVAHTVAQRLGTKAYFYGTIKGSAAPWVLHVNLVNTASNDVMASSEQRVPSLGELPDAIDRISDELRSGVGEDSDSIARTHVPLSREGTSNLEALHAFSEAKDALYSGHTLDGLRLLQQAVKLEPRFVPAQLRLTVLYRKERAELAAADSARLALAAADTTSERTRTLAQYEYEVNASGDYVRATAIIRKLVTANPHDSQALECLSRVLRLQGRMTESLTAAQQAYAADPLNIDAYTQADNALIGLDRYDASYQMQGQMQRLGIARPGGLLTSAYLEGRQEALDNAVATYVGHQGGYRPDWNYGLYLDNIGQLAAGLAHWRRNSQAAIQTPGLESAGGFLLSQAALNRALIGDCATGLGLAHDASSAGMGMMGLFNGGMARALCGDAAGAQQAMTQLQAAYPQSFAVTSFYIADIKGAMALRVNDPAAAIEALKPARQFDLISLTPYLRGRAHVALRQGPLGIVDYQTVLAHHGVSFIVGSDVYPVAEIGVARAFADTGDINNSSDAYKRFLELWKNADPNQPLLAEARAHVKDPTK